MEPSHVHDEMPASRAGRTRRRRSAGDGFELYEEDDRFVLSIEMPGFERKAITDTWDDGRLFVVAETEARDRGRQRRFRRTFRLPKEVEPDDIETRYQRGILEVQLPTTAPHTSGRKIEVHPG